MARLEVLTTAFDGLAPLHRPIMVLALRGWFDIAEVATDAVEHLDDGNGTIVASIDPDPFFDFTQERPQVEFDDAELRQVLWPENEFRVVRHPNGNHDLVILAGVEPHLRFGTFVDAILTVIDALGCEMVVTVGAAAEAVPHTRAPMVVGSSANDGLARALGLARPQYQGVTGLVGVLQERLDREGIPAVSLRVGVPHYLGNAKHPQSSISLLQHLEHVLGVPTNHHELVEDAVRWRSVHDEVVEDDPQALAYVQMLEREHDRRADAMMTSGDDLAAQLEEFLREQRDDDT